MKSGYGSDFEACVRLTSRHELEHVFVRRYRSVRDDRQDFGTWSLKQPVVLSEWVLSVDREAPYRGPTFGLFDEARDLRPEGLDGLSPNYLFGPYRQDQAKFSCVVKDQWAMAMLLRILAWRA